MGDKTRAELQAELEQMRADRDALRTELQSQNAANPNARADTPGAGFAPVGLAPTLSEQGAQEAQRVADSEHAARANIDGAIEIVNPNGMRVKLDMFLDHLYLQGDHTSIFAEPQRFMKDPLPGCMYVWAAKKDPYCWARVRSGAYRPVEKHEVREDNDIPMETHVMSGREYVAVFDVLLMEVRPEAVKRLYKQREATAAVRTANNLAFKELRSRIEGESKGIASAELIIKNVGD